MGIPTEHTKLIHRTGFPVPVTTALDGQERGLLTRYGYWLEALASGAIAPITPDQQQFVRVACGDAEPRSAFEVAWVKFSQIADAVSTQVGPLELANRLAKLGAARAAATAAQDEYSARRVAILEQVRSQLDALDAEFADRLAATSEVSARLEAEARAAVLVYGGSFRHAGIHAVYTKCRVTWDSKGLARYLESHPGVGEFRRVSAPSVSLRFQPPEALPRHEPS